MYSLLLWYLHDLEFYSNIMKNKLSHFLSARHIHTICPEGINVDANKISIVNKHYKTNRHTKRKKSILIRQGRSRFRESKTVALNPSSMILGTMFIRKGCYIFQGWCCIWKTEIVKNSWMSLDYLTAIQVE